MAKKSKSHAAAPASNGAFDLNNIQHWRSVARQMDSDEDNKWHVGEMAVAMKEIGDCIGKEWSKISRLCDKTETSTVTFNVSVRIDRKETPPSVRVSLGYSEKHGTSAESDVPDEDQIELPGLGEPKARAEMKVPDEEKAAA